MIQKGIFLVAILFAALSARAQENCWGKPVDKARIAQLLRAKTMFQADHPFTELFRVLEKFVPESVDFVYDENPEFNASATNMFGRRVVTMHQGVATHALSNPDTSALVACHEVGHHFGGAPLIWGMSVEGQSDFYGIQECFRNWVDSTAPFDPKDQEAADYCDKNLGRRDMLCVRSLSASLHLARIISEVKQHPKPFLASKDSSVVTRTATGHPIAQCRLDTYKAGYEFLAGGKTLGETRPLCWFKPGEPRAPLSLTANLLN